MRKTYGVNAEVLFPPFDFQYWQKIAVQSPKQEKPYFLFVGRLEPYKRINLLIRAFNELPDKTLLIIGSGSERENLEEEANGNITFIEKLTDEELASYYQNAQALLMPQAEEFGYTALESVVFGCPVICFAKSGAVEFLRETKMGIFFEEQTVAAITEKIVNFHTKSYNRGKIDWRKYEGEKFIARVRREIGEIGR
jgi:glycosyltransferase involved in cell wall biosynthesis